MLYKESFRLASMASIAQVFALIDCRLEGGHARFAGLAVEAFSAGDRSPGILAYLESLPDWIVPTIVAAAPEGVWAPCSVCGEGIIISRPAVPQKPRADLDGQGSRCRLTWTTVTIGNLTTNERCPGRHYPLEGPWLASHPLGRQLVPEAPW